MYIYIYILIHVYSPLGQGPMLEITAQGKLAKGYVHICIYAPLGFCCEWFTVVSVHHGFKAKAVGQTYTCITCAHDRCGVKGGGYGVTQSHPWCDPCYILILLK